MSWTVTEDCKLDLHLMLLRRFSPFMSSFSQTHQRLISWALARLSSSHTCTVAVA